MEGNNPRNLRCDGGEGPTGVANDDGPDAATEWPVHLSGITETIVTTLGTNGRWNVAALGVHAPAETTGDGFETGDIEIPVDPASLATARTWGRTRTWRNFNERGSGYIQFNSDPVAFVSAALDTYEVDEPILSGTDCWVAVTVKAAQSGSEGDTDWTDWLLVPTDYHVENREVPTFSRGFAAVVEATVAASRLDVPAYDTATLLERIDYLEDVAARCGGPREQEAFETLRTLLDR